jgi:uncharacterized protein (DUF736 family)
MAYEQKPGQGSIFKNEKKAKDTHPDYNGTILDPNGNKWDLSLWVKESTTGKKYFSVSVKEPYVKDSAPATTTETDNDLPF